MRGGALKVRECVVCALWVRRGCVSASWLRRVCVCVSRVCECVVVTSWVRECVVVAAMVRECIVVASRVRECVVEEEKWCLISSELRSAYVRPKIFLKKLIPRILDPYLVPIACRSHKKKNLLELLPRLLCKRRFCYIFRKISLCILIY